MRPARGDGRNFRGVEAGRRLLALLGEELTERGCRVRVVAVRPGGFRCHVRGGFWGVCFFCALILAAWAWAALAVGNALRWRVPARSRQSAMNFPHFFCMVEASCFELDTGTDTTGSDATDSAGVGRVGASSLS